MSTTASLFYSPVIVQSYGFTIMKTFHFAKSMGIHNNKMLHLYSAHQKGFMTRIEHKTL